MYIVSDQGTYQLGAKLYAEESFLLGIDWSLIYSTVQFLKGSMVQYISIIFFLHITI